MREFTCMHRHNKCAGGDDKYRQTPVLLWRSGRIRIVAKNECDAFINGSKHEHKSTMWICTLENQPRRESVVNTFEYANVSWHKKSLDRRLLHDSSGCRYNGLKGHYRKSKDRGWRIGGGAVPDSCWVDVYLLPVFIHLWVHVCVYSQRNLTALEVLFVYCLSKSGIDWDAHVWWQRHKNMWKCWLLNL